MKLKVPYWYYTKAFSDEECDKIIESGLRQIEMTQEESKAKVQTDDSKDGKVDIPIRDCQITWLDDTWLYQRVENMIINANEEAGWGWTIHSMEKLQFVRYNLNEHYSWHVDGSSDIFDVYADPNNLNYFGKIRKISVSVNLSDPNDYDGGELLFVDNTVKDGVSLDDMIYSPKEFKGKGSSVVFPSFAHHKVTPVTRGTRYSLVAWILGPPWK